MPDGGFALRPGGGYRPEATSWAVMALQLWGISADLLRPARARIAAEQNDDGRIAVAPGHARAFWPTPLAVFAWHGDSDFIEPRSRAVSFLLKTTGTYFKKEEGIPVGHDPSIKGWPWIMDTHSWVEPTSLTIAALCIEGYGKHERVDEGVRLLIDRQLESGGWNYGNTTVFGTELSSHAGEYRLGALSAARLRKEAGGVAQHRLSQEHGRNTHDSFQSRLGTFRIVCMGRAPAKRSQYAR